MKRLTLEISGKETIHISLFSTIPPHTPPTLLNEEPEYHHRTKEAIKEAFYDAIQY